MSTGSKVVLLLSFVFIGVLVWYYGPSSTTTDQIIEDPVLQSSPAVMLLRLLCRLNQSPA